MYILYICIEVLICKIINASLIFIHCYFNLSYLHLFVYNDLHCFIYIHNLVVSINNNL